MSSNTRKEVVLTAHETDDRTRYFGYSSPVGGASRTLAQCGRRGTLLGAIVEYRGVFGASD